MKIQTTVKITNEQKLTIQYLVEALMKMCEAPGHNEYWEKFDNLFDSIQWEVFDTTNQNPTLSFKAAKGSLFAAIQFIAKDMA